MDIRKMLLLIKDKECLDRMRELYASLGDTEWSLVEASDPEEVYSLAEIGDAELFFTEPSAMQDVAPDYLRRIRRLAPRMYQVMLNRNDMSGLRNNRLYREIQQFIELKDMNNGSLQLLIGIATQVKKMHAIEEELKHLSYYDGLTGLSNRRAFEQEMYRLDADLVAPVGVFTFDLDGLKIINDTLGHLAGDELIMRCANILQMVFEKYGLIARLGGDEFACIVPNATTDLMEKLQQEIDDAVTEYGMRVGSLPLHISCGWEIRTSLSHNMDEIYRRADSLMYHEKLKNANRSRNSIIAMILKIRRDKNIGRLDGNLRMEKMLMDICTRLNLDEEQIGNLLKLVQYYDIGKISIADDILHKPGPLAPDEAVEVRQYCEVGYKIALSIPQLAPIAELILKQHEWWNGNGYPLGLKGADIPIECRILAVVEAYSTMTSDRPYRGARDHDDAIEEMRRFSGIQFDPAVTEVFIDLVEFSSALKAGSR